jgi:hypothetical protein
MTDAAKLPPPMSSLSFPFRGRRVAVTHVSSVSPEQAVAAVASEPFQTWYGRIEASQSNNSGSGGEEGGLRMEIRGVEIQSVDMFGARYVVLLVGCWLASSFADSLLMASARGNPHPWRIDRLCSAVPVTTRSSLISYVVPGLFSSIFDTIRLAEESALSRSKRIADWWTPRRVRKS